MATGRFEAASSHSDTFNFNADRREDRVLWQMPLLGDSTKVFQP